MCLCHNTQASIYRNGWMDGAGFWHGGFFIPIPCMLYCEENRVSSKIRVLSSGLCPKHTHTHTHTCLTTLCPGLPGWAGTRKLKPIWILLKQETVSGSGISWAICKSALRSRQITMQAPHHLFFTGRMPFLPRNQQRQSTEGMDFVPNSGLKSSQHYTLSAKRDNGGKLDYHQSN